MHLPISLARVLLSSLLFLYSPSVAAKRSEPRQLNEDPQCNLSLAYGGLAQRATIHVPNWAGGDPQLRSFNLHLPQNYNASRPTPVYFAFHGGGKNATEMEKLTSLSDEAYNDNAIVVYAQGKISGKGERYWLSNPEVDPSAVPNDLDYVAAVLDCLEDGAKSNDTLNIDTSRIYAMGKSNGGGFVHTLACNSTVGRRFAAFAAVSGAFYNTDDIIEIGPCNPSANGGPTTTPFIEFHGWQNDCWAPYFGKASRGTCTDAHCQQRGVPVVSSVVPQLAGFLGVWTKLNGCSAAPQQNYYYQGADGPVTDVNVSTWTCQPGFGPVLKHYNQTNIGHVWPSTFYNDDCANISCPKDEQSQCPLGKYYYNATTEIIDFFQPFKLNGSRYGYQSLGSDAVGEMELGEEHLHGTGPESGGTEDSYQRDEL